MPLRTSLPGDPAAGSSPPGNGSPGLPLARASAALVAVLVVLALAGWILDQSNLASFVAGGVTLAPDAGSPFVLYAVALLPCAGAAVGLALAWPRTNAALEIANKNLQEAGDCLEAITQSAADAIVIGDAAGNIVGWNRAAGRIFGYREDEVLGRPLAILMPARYRDQHERGLRGACSAEEDRFVERMSELQGVTKEGREFPLELSLSNWRTSKGPFFTGIIRDITERKRDQETLLCAVELFRGLVEQSIAGIYIVVAGKLTYANPRCAQIMGYDSPEQMVGLDFASLVAEKDRERSLAHLRGPWTGPSICYTFTGTRKDGSEVEIGTHDTDARFDGQPAVIGLMQDISDNRNAERQIAGYIRQLEGTMKSALLAISNMVELRDPYTSGHERRVGILSAAIASEMGWDAMRCEAVEMIGLVHDIGKISLPAEILSKPSRLSAIEMRLVQGHSQAGYDVLKNVDFPWPVALATLQHHERMDGSGYPYGSRGDAIIPEARVLAVADVVEAMSSHRPYRPGLGIDMALDEIERGADRTYDAKVVAACLRLFREKGYSLPA